MTKQQSTLREGRSRPSLHILVALLFGAVVAIGGVRVAAAHAEPERASPPISGVVATAPAIVEIWFDEDLDSEGTTILVIGPGGIQVDLGDAAVDLQDPERKHVTVSLRPELEPGVYTVQWTSLSASDGDAAQGGYIFTVGDAIAGASPVVSPAADAATLVTPTPDSTPSAIPVEENANFDSQGFFLSVAAGLGVAVLIFIFWRAVRPRKPTVQD